MCCKWGQRDWSRGINHAVSFPAGILLGTNIDWPQISEQNARMKMQEDPVISDQDADAQAVIEHAMTGKPLDPEIARRVRTRSERATGSPRRKRGTRNIAVELSRAVRVLRRFSIPIATTR